MPPKKRKDGEKALLPIKSSDFLERPVKFCVKRPADDDSTGSNSNKKPNNSRNNENSVIWDVLDISRPCGVPKYWFHPPGDIGPFKWKTLRHLGRGMTNFANICFLNATIQCLAYCIPFSEDCLAGKHWRRCARRARGEVCGFCHFERHIRHLLMPSPNQKAKEAVAWSGALLQIMRKEIKMNQGNWFGYQNCAHEWLVQFLDFLTKYDLPPEVQQDFETGRVNMAELATSYIHQIFSGRFQDVKTCMSCQKSTMVYDLNSCIRVALNGSKSLDKALHEAFKTEMLTGANSPMCENCGVVRTKKAERFLHDPPSVLVVLLQRSELRREPRETKPVNRYFASPVEKNTSAMEVPLTLDMSAFMSPEKPSNELYDLVGAVNHAGSASFGHYWALIRGPDGAMYAVDDEHNHPVAESQVARELASAYLVFYLRRKVPARSLNAPLYSGTPEASAEANPWKLRLSLEILPDALDDIPEPPEIEEEKDILRLVQKLPPRWKKMPVAVDSDDSTLPCCSSEEEDLEGDEERKMLISLLCSELRKTSSHVPRFGTRRCHVAAQYAEILRSKEDTRVIPDERDGKLCGTKRSASTPDLPVRMPKFEHSVDYQDDNDDLSPTTPRQPAKRSKKEEPLKPEVRIELARSLKTQYGPIGSRVSVWSDDEEDSRSASHLFSKKQSEVSPFQQLQKALAPKINKRSREEKEYDRGKTKKVKTIEEKAKIMKEREMFNFKRLADKRQSKRS